MLFKKLLPITAAGILAIGLSACGDSDSASNPNNTPEDPGTVPTDSIPDNPANPGDSIVPPTDSLPPATDTATTEFTVPEEAAEITPAITIPKEAGKGFLIDDFEDGDNESLIPKAFWYTYDDNDNFRDTLYVCKGATIANVTINGSTSSGIIPYSEVQSKFGVSLTGTLVIPRYWYMAVLRLKNGQYEAMAFWTEQINSSCSTTTLQSCMITIDELERRTGIDFFCNLPDDIEEEVESTLNTSIWQ